MVRMISATYHRFDGRVLSKDEIFECEERFVPVLEALGRARRHQEYQTRELRARKYRRKGR